MRTFVQGASTAIPEAHFSTTELLQAMQRRVSPALVRSITEMGVEERYAVVQNLPGVMSDRQAISSSATTTDLAVQALSGAVSVAEATPPDIGVLICVTNTQSSVTPGLGPCVIARARNHLRPTTPVINMQGQGCAALLKAVEVAQWFLEAHPNKVAVVIAAEAQSPYVPRLTAEHYGTFREAALLQDAEQRRVAANNTLALTQAMLFGDGAAALVLGPREARLEIGPVAHLTNEQPDDERLLAIDDGGTIAPWGNGGPPRYFMHADVPKRGVSYVNAVVGRLLGEDLATAGPREFSSLLLHTGSRKILDGICTSLGVPNTAASVRSSYDILARYGNLSGASLGFMLARTDLPSGPGLAVGFGAGFSASAALLRVR